LCSSTLTYQSQPEKVMPILRAALFNGSAAASVALAVQQLGLGKRQIGPFPAEFKPFGQTLTQPSLTSLESQDPDRLKILR
jgi:hypothetical protein